MIRVAFICVGFVLTNTVSRMRSIVIQASVLFCRERQFSRCLSRIQISLLLEYLEETEVALPSASRSHCVSERTG